VDIKLKKISGVEVLEEKVAKVLADGRICRFPEAI
jgi:hypothetical protein